MKPRYFIPILLAVFLLHSGFGREATKKKEVQKQIDALNHTVQEAANKGELQKAITAAEDVLDLAKKEFGDSSIEAAKAMNNVANLYLFIGHPTDAERLYKDSIILEVTKYGNDNVEIADSLYNLGMAYAMQKKYGEALKMVDRVLKIRKEKLGANHPETLKAQEMATTLWKESTGQ